MKKEFVKQLNLCVVIVLLFSVMNTLFRHWIFSSIGFVACGLIWIMHPVKINDIRSEKSQLIECRIAGSVLVLLGLMLRARLYI